MTNRTIRFKGNDRDVSQPTEVERETSGRAEAEQVLTEIGLILAVMLGIAVVGHSFALMAG